MIDLESQIRRIDMVQVGDQHFMLRVGMGFAGQPGLLLAARS